MSKTEVIRMNPLGPHFYVNDSRPFSFPEKWRDAITDRMNQMLAELDNKHGWNITHAHVKGHTAITTVEWDEDGFTIEPFDVSLDWYSRSQLHEWDF